MLPDNEITESEVTQFALVHIPKGYSNASVSHFSNKERLEEHLQGLARSIADGDDRWVPRSFWILSRDRALEQEALETIRLQALARLWTREAELKARGQALSEMSSKLPVPEDELCDECGHQYPHFADALAGPWHMTSCSLHQGNQA